MAKTTTATMPSQDEVVDAVVATSRALVGLAVRSLAASSADVTMVQYRALVVLAYQGDQRVADLAENLGVNSSTATRLVARLSRKGLVDQVTDPDDRRATRVAVTTPGRHIIEAVRDRRRAEVARVMRSMPVDTSETVVEWLTSFVRAAGEGDEQSWGPGWSG